MDLEEKYFPLAFEEIRKLMKHGATTHRDDQEWREHSAEDHLQHASDHAADLENLPEATYNLGHTDKGSGLLTLVHVACRDLMALEVHLGGGVVK